MSETRAPTGKRSSARSRGGSPIIPWLVVLISMAALSSTAFRFSHSTAVIAGPNLRASGRAIDETNLPRSLLDQANQHCAGAAAGPGHHDGPGIRLPVRARLAD